MTLSLTKLKAQWDMASAVFVLLLVVFPAYSMCFPFNRYLVNEWICSVNKTHCYSFDTWFQGTLTLSDLIILCTFTVPVLWHLYICPIYQPWRMLAKGRFHVRFARLCLMPLHQRGRTSFWDPGSWVPGSCDLQGSLKVGQPDPPQKVLSWDVLLENYIILLRNTVFFLEVIFLWEKGQDRWHMTTSSI